MTARKFYTKMSRGFTLIELLIVMAILGVLAVVVLVAINPAEQMRRARDAGRVSAVQQLGRALTAYYTANGQYPAAASWDTDITTSGDLNTFPAAVSTTETSNCTGGDKVNEYCYKVATVVNTNDQIVVYAQLYSQQQDNRCATPATEIPYSVFSSYDGKGGIVCAEPGAGSALTYR